jgi:3'-5' exoribonuclease
MARRFVKQLADGESIEEVFLVGDKQLRPNRNGNHYLQVDLRDRTGNIIARLWNASDVHFRAFEAGDFLFIKGKVQLYQGALQIILSHFQKHEAQNAELTDFLPHTEHDVNKLLEKLRGSLRKFASPHLKALAECFLIDADLMRAFAQVPAGVRNHHAYVGGLLEHVVNMLEVAERIAPNYPNVDRDLLSMGIFLHDIGKTRELTCGKGFTYTDEGQLTGHIVLGVEMLNEKVTKASELTGEPFPRELLLRLKHMIISHHGELVFGSPVVPMTPEAIALHYLDNLDAKSNTFVREIREDHNTTTSWTQYSQTLGRRLYKGGNGSNSGESEVEPIGAE